MAEKEPSKEAKKALQTAQRGEFAHAKSLYVELKPEDQAYVRKEHPAFGAFVS